MTPAEENYKNIPGWGIDADPENEPTYPMKTYTGDDHKRSNYERSSQQPATVEILMSNERPKLPAVFGTTVPPSGLSGAIRRYAFKHSEDRYRHWLPLIFADRVNVWEGLIDDIKKGHFPNILAERGWKSELKHNKAAVIKKVFIGAFVIAAVCGSLSKRRK
jgi:hypothetical protein